jgi:uncharacterized membrane protein
MEIWIAYPALYLHMLSAVAWVGGAFFINLVLTPGIDSLLPSARRSAWVALIRRLDRYLTVAGIATISFGALSGIAVQRYHEAIGLESRWGWAIAGAAVLTVIAFACGKYSGVISERVLLDDRYWQDDPSLNAERDHVLALGTRLDRFELVLLPIVLALMALARFS